MLYRAFNICKTWKLFHKEIKFLKNYFLNNGYPRNIVELQIRKFLNNIFTPKEKEKEKKEKTTVYLKLPYYGSFSNTIQKDISKVLNPIFPNHEFVFICSNNFSLSTLFPFKDKIPTDLQTRVIYRYICDSCNKSYYGETSRNFRTRMFEHAGLSSDTGKEVVGSPTAIKQHKLSSKHPVKLENFSIIDYARTDYQLHIIESLHIRFDKPELNKQVQSEILYTVT